jgi:DNA-binding GntR family transcriptional regulator
VSEARLDRSLLSDQVYDLVRERILRHDLTPGTRIVESEIARQLGISQAPVREALRKLSHEGLILQLPHRGSFVAEISVHEARQAYHVRAALEEVAATEALANMDESTLSTLQDCLDSMLKSARANDHDGLIDADMRFHRAVWQASGNPLLARMWPIVETSMRQFVRVSNQVYFGNLLEIARTHDPLLEGLRERDPAVVPQFSAHVNEVWERVSRSIANKERT